MAKHAAPPKKGAKKSAPPKKAAAEKSEVKPVKAPSRPEAAPKEYKKPKTNGNYKWLLKRLQKQALNALSTPNNRNTVRDGMDKCETFTSTRQYLQQAGVADGQKFDDFLDEFFAATIDR